MTSRLLLRALVAVLALSLLPTAAAAAPQIDDATAGSDRGPDSADPAAEGNQPFRDPAAPPASEFATPLPSSQTDGCALSTYPTDPYDASIAIGAYAYADVMAALCDLDAASDRISVEVAGLSTQGRELPLLTITSAESAAERASDDAFRDLQTTDPEAALAAISSGQTADFKPNILFNGNIHGNEWEGTDAILDLATYLASADGDDPFYEFPGDRDPAEIADLPTVDEVLDELRIVSVVTVNPDGRVTGTRRNANDIDMNRDFITHTQPEARAAADAIIATQPLAFLDMHGYVSDPSIGAAGLVEPTTPPHGSAYEYDLFVGQAYPQGIAMEDEVLRRTDLMPSWTDETTQVVIPFRDWEDGWDDWPPIFTPQFAAFHGIVASTNEFPYNPRVIEGEERAAAVASNIAWSRATLDATVANALAARDDLLTDQTEVYRRGLAGEPSRNADIPDDFVPGWDEADRRGIDTTFPRAYVLAKGGEATDDAAADRLAAFLLSVDVDVAVADTDLTIDGVTYAVGSYVVDMHQAKRGMAQVALDDGTDISELFDFMYDISGWSLARLWGADVTAVPEGADESFLGGTTPIEEVSATGGVAEGEGIAYAFRADSAAGITALTALWDAEIALQRSVDGTILAAAADADVLAEVGAETGVTFVPVRELPAERYELSPPRLGVVVDGQHANASVLRDDLGIDFSAVSADALADNVVDLDRFDVLLVSGSSLTYADLSWGREPLDAWVADGGSVVTIGPVAAAELVGAAGWIPGFGLDQVAPGDPAANGVARVDSSTGGDVLPNRPADDVSFVYDPGVFDVAGVEALDAIQTYAADPLLSGHWIGNADAAGLAATAAGQVTDSRFVLLGSAPLFRGHPQGLFADVWDAVLWADDPAPTTDPLVGITRLSGSGRIETAIAISDDQFDDGAADTVVLTRADEYADALAGTPVAVAANGPLLVTDSNDLVGIVADELTRVLPAGGTVHVLGGTEAIEPQVVEAVEALGYDVVRVSGPSRIETAVAIAGFLDDPASLLVTTGYDYPDALTAGAAAAGTGDGAVLLTTADAPHPAVDAYLAETAAEEVVAVGGPAARAYPDLDALVGTTREGTAVAVAEAFFDTPVVVGVARRDAFPDALAGGAHIARAGGPLLLTYSDELADEFAGYLGAADTIVGGYAYGGTAALSDELLDEIARIIGRG